MVLVMELWRWWESGVGGGIVVMVEKWCWWWNCGGGGKMLLVVELWWKNGVGGGIVGARSCRHFYTAHCTQRYPRYRSKSFHDFTLIQRLIKEHPPAFYT